ncbi:hypothetical protein [uncultured Chryseobacterium sp.]|uniref:hypothetical protein n=1 Tax=uncultured Chryseobacterium sp. TaxID=259322 RepID=UPI0026166504|nr:hypothetical protein [uncultured Chryseobacterium sp.]
MASCTKTEKSEYDNTAQGEAEAAEAAVSDEDVARCNEDEALLDEKSKEYTNETEADDSSVDLKSTNGEDIHILFEEKPEGGQSAVTFTKGTEAPVKLPFVEYNNGIELYGKDGITPEVYNSDKKAVWTCKSKQSIEYQ